MPNSIWKLEHQNSPKSSIIIFPLNRSEKRKTRREIKVIPFLNPPHFHGHFLWGANDLLNNSFFPGLTTTTEKSSLFLSSAASLSSSMESRSSRVSNLKLKRNNCNKFHCGKLKLYTNYIFFAFNFGFKKVN